MMDLSTMLRNLEAEHRTDLQRLDAVYAERREKLYVQALAAEAQAFDQRATAAANLAHIERSVDILRRAEREQFEHLRVYAYYTGPGANLLVAAETPQTVRDTHQKLLHTAKTSLEALGYFKALKVAEEVRQPIALHCVLYQSADQVSLLMPVHYGKREETGTLQNKLYVHTAAILVSMLHEATGTAPRLQPLEVQIGTGSITKICAPSHPLDADLVLRTQMHYAAQLPEVFAKSFVTVQFLTDIAGLQPLQQRPLLTREMLTPKLVQQYASVADLKAAYQVPSELAHAFAGLLAGKTRRAARGQDLVAVEKAKSKSEDLPIHNVADAFGISASTIRARLSLQRIKRSGSRGCLTAEEVTKFIDSFQGKGKRAKYRKALVTLQQSQ